MIETIKKLLGLRRKTTGIKIVINYEKLERRVALLENDKLEEYNTERDTDRNMVGGVFKGIVRNIEPGIKAMFVDIGFEKNAFLQFWDAIPASLDSGIEAVKRAETAKKTKRITARDVPNIYPVGSEIMVQVKKGPISNKGPRVTTDISLAGRYLVLMPYNDQCGISRKIEDPAERDRLRKILHELDIPDGMGVIMRTVGQGQKARFFVRDLSLLLEQWEVVRKGMEEIPAPATLFQEPDLVGQISKRSRSRIQLFRGQGHIFDEFQVHKQIEEAFHRQVWLPCGGYIVIDETEALIAIDVNTGRNKGSKDMEKTILQTNLEAADEIARQLRLRNIGGIIIGDFIDMKSRKDQQMVYQRIRERLKRDKARTHVLPISQLGLMEMTRQRAAESLSSSQYIVCPYCNGKGNIKSPMSMSVELQRALHSIMSKYQEKVHEFRVIVPPSLLERLRTEDDELLVDIERRYAGRLSFRSDPLMHQEKFVIANAENGDELQP